MRRDPRSRAATRPAVPVPARQRVLSAAPPRSLGLEQETPCLGQRVVELRRVLPAGQCRRRARAAPTAAAHDRTQRLDQLDRVGCRLRWPPRSTPWTRPRSPRARRPACRRGAAPPRPATGDPCPRPCRAGPRPPRPQRPAPRASSPPPRSTAGAARRAPSPSHAGARSGARWRPPTRRARCAAPRPPHGRAPHGPWPAAATPCRSGRRRAACSSRWSPPRAA